MHSSMRKKLKIRCFHFDEDGRPLNPPCKRGTFYCGFVHPDEAAWVTASISENYEPPNRDRRSDHGHGRGHHNDYDDYDRPPPPRKTPASELIATIAEEQARSRQEASNSPAASSSRVKSSTIPSAPRSLSQLDIPKSEAAIVGPSSASPTKTSSASMSALNPSASTHQQQTASTTTPTTKPSAKSTPRPTPIIPPPPNSGGFSNTFSSLSLDSPGFSPNNTTSQPQSKPADDDAMHVDQPLSSSSLNQGSSRPSPSDAQHHSASPAGSTSQPPPPPPNPPPELPYQPPPPIPGVPDGLKFPEDRSRQPSMAPSDAGSGSGSGRRPSLSIAQDDPRYVKWMTVIRVLSRCMDIEAELRTIDRNIEDARSFIAIGAMERLDSSLDGLSASSSTAVPLTPTAGASSSSSTAPPPPGSTTPTSATAPGFSIPSNSTVLPPMELSEELTSLIARRESLLKEKTESWDELANPDSWPTALQQPPGLVPGAGVGGDGEGSEPPVDYRALVGAVADFKDMVRSLMQLLAEHIAFFEKKRKMPEMPEELRDLRMEDEEEGEEVEDERVEEGEEDERDELDRELEREMERQERMEYAAREEVDGDVVPEVGNLSLEEGSKDGDVTMHDAEDSSARNHKALKQEEEDGGDGGSLAETGRGHKRRRLNMAGAAEPTPEEVEQMRSALQKLEDKITSILNDSIQAEETWKEEYEIMVEERVNAYMKDHVDNHKKRMLRYRNKVKELEKEKAAWEEREKEREQGSAVHDEPDAEQEEQWMRMLHNETVTVQQGPDQELQMSFSKLWGDVQGLQGDLEPVRAEVAYTKAEVAELTHELAMERVELAKVKNETDRVKESLEKQIQEQQELESSIAAIDTYIRNTAEEIAAHRAALAAAPPPPPPMPSQRVLLQYLEPLLIDAIREDIKPTLVKHREEIEHTVQDGAKQLFMQFATKLGLTMNIMEAIHKRMDDEPGMLESLANSIQPSGSSTSSS